MTEIVKMVRSEPDGTKKQVFPQSHANAIIGLNSMIKETANSVTSVNGKTGDVELDLSNSEIVDARTNHNGETYASIGDRINFSEKEIETKLSEISNVPETFSNLSDLKAKYPNGKAGLFVTADDGHKYIWSHNQWVDSGVYQSVGLAENSVSVNNIQKNAVTFRAYSWDKLPDYNSDTKTLTFNSETVIEIGEGNIDNNNRYTISQGTTVTNPNNMGAFFKVLYNISTGNISIVGQKETVDKNELVLSTISGMGNIAGTMPMTFNGSYTNSPKDIPMLDVLLGGDPVDGQYLGIILRFDIDAKKLIIPKLSSTLTLRDNSGRRFGISDEVIVDITNIFVSPFSGYIVFNRNNISFSYQNFDYKFKSSIDAIVATMRYVNGKLHVHSNIPNLTIDSNDMVNGIKKINLMPNTGTQEIYTSIPLKDTTEKYPNFIPSQRKIIFPRNTGFYTANGKVRYMAANLVIDLSYDYATAVTITKDYASGAVFFNSLKTRFEFWVDHLPADLTGYYIHSWVSYNWKAPDYGTWQTTIPYLVEGTLLRSPAKNELKQLIKENSGSGDVSLPQYYTDYMLEKYNEIKTLMRELQNGDAFIFITDTHWGDNVQVSPKIIQHIKRNTNIQKVIFGGDIVRAFGTKDNIVDDVDSFNSEMSDFCREGKYFPTIGNHDFTIKYTKDSNDKTGYTYDLPFSYNASARMLESYANVVNQKMYYYFDNPVQKMRYIIVNTEERIDAGDKPWGIGAYITQKQLDWLTDEALAVPDDEWHVVVVGHVPIHPDAPSHDGNLDILRLALEGYKNKNTTDYTSSYGTVLSKNFSEYKGNIVGYFCGHNHKDTEFVGENLVNISTGCDAKYNDDVWSRDENTINEQLFDVVIVNKDTKNINMIRIGAGNNRNFSY